MENGKYGVLVLGGRRTHQESYAHCFAEDERCELIAASDELDAPPEYVKLNRQLAEDLQIPYIPDLNEALHVMMSISSAHASKTSGGGV